MAGKGLAALAPNGLRFSHSDQTNISPDLSRALNALSREFGETVTVTSGYRSPEYNAKVGSSKGSYHVKGQAADIDMTGWSDAKKQRAVETLAAMGVGGFITYDTPGEENMLHVDLRQNLHFMFNKTAAKMKNAPAWFKDIAAKVGPKTAIQRQMTQEMAVPSQMTREQALAAPLSPEEQNLANAYTQMGASKATAAQMAREASIASAYSDPSRALDVQSPPNLAAAPVGMVTRGPSLAAPAPTPARPDNLSYAGPKGHFSVKPTASDLLGLTGPARTNPAPHPGLNMPNGPVRSAEAQQRANMPSVSLPSRPSAPTAKAAGTPTAGYNPTAKAAGTPTSGYNPTAKAAGTPTVGYQPSAPSTASLAAQHQAYRSPTQYAGVTNQIALDKQKQKTIDAYSQYAASRMAAPPTPPPGLAPPAPTVITPPALVTRPPVQNLPIAPIAPPVAAPRSRSAYVGPPVAPALRPSDIYGGVQGTAIDSMGNTIGRDAHGTTTVSNQFGATTGMRNGYQTAYGSMPSIPGIEGPSTPSAGLGKIGGKMRTGATTLGTAALGAALAGPLGAVVGGLLGREMSKPGGLLNRQSFNTQAFGTINAARAQGGGAFPSAPAAASAAAAAAAAAKSRAGFGNGGDRPGYSPAASRDIAAGKSGLY